LNGPRASLDGNHPAIAPLNGSRTGRYFNQTAIFALYGPTASRNGDHPSIVTLNGSRPNRHLDHSAVASLYGARASPDGDHVAIFTLNASRTIGNYDADPVGACKFAWHAIAPVHTRNNDNGERLSFHDGRLSPETTEALGRIPGVAKSM
jgi:hypothetical protein